MERVAVCARNRATLRRARANQPQKHRKPRSRRNQKSEAVNLVNFVHFVHLEQRNHEQGRRQVRAIGKLLLPHIPAESLPPTTPRLTSKTWSADSASTAILDGNCDRIRQLARTRERTGARRVQLYRRAEARVSGRAEIRPTATLPPAGRIPRAPQSRRPRGGNQNPRPNTKRRFSGKTRHKSALGPAHAGYH